MATPTREKFATQVNSDTLRSVPTLAEQEHGIQADLQPGLADLRIRDMDIIGRISKGRELCVEISHPLVFFSSPSPALLGDLVP
jgi:hypothetical protein